MSVAASTELAAYYEDETVALYHGDYRDVLPGLPADSAHLLLVDPPYGQEFQSNRRKVQLDMIAGDDGSFDTGELLRAACRVLRRGRHAYVFGPASMDGTPLAAAVQLVWDKEIIGTGDLSLPRGLSHEAITFAVYEPSKANREKGYGRLAARMRQGSVIRCARLQSSQVKHPNQKPLRLLRELIESSSVMGETVLDPCAGSGSTLVAAVLEGRKAVGVEVDERYCEMTAERLRKRDEREAS